MSTTTELLTGYGEEKENASNRKPEMPICKSRFGKYCTVLPHEVLWKWSMSRHRTKKDKEVMSHFEKFVTEGKEKADELAKEGAMLDDGFIAETRARTVQQEREEVYAALQYAASFHCLVKAWKDCEELKPKPKEKLIFVDKIREETKHRTEWCTDANKYRCMRCGGKCTGPIYMSENFGKWRKRHLGGHDLARRIDGTKIHELLQARASGHKRAWNMLIRIQALEDGRIHAKDTKMNN